MLFQTLGVLIQGAGIFALFLHWRARRSHGAGFLAAGWALIALGAAPWFFDAAPERALAIAAFAPMVAGLTFLAPDALPRIGTNTVRKKSKPIVDSDEGDAPPAGRALRNAGRWFAALIAAPIMALAGAAAYQAFTPGSIADRTVFSGFFAIAIWSAGSLWLLAAAKPWRASGIACAIAVFLSAAVFMVLSQGVA